MPSFVEELSHQLTREFPHERFSGGIASRKPSAGRSSNNTTNKNDSTNKSHQSSPAAAKPSFLQPQTPPSSESPPQAPKAAYHQINEHARERRMSTTSLQQQQQHNITHHHGSRSDPHQGKRHSISPAPLAVEENSSAGSSISPTHSDDSLDEILTNIHTKRRQLKSDAAGVAAILASETRARVLVEEQEAEGFAQLREKQNVRRQALMARLRLRCVNPELPDGIKSRIQTRNASQRREHANHRSVLVEKRRDDRTKSVKALKSKEQRVLDAAFAKQEQRLIESTERAQLARGAMQGRVATVKDALLKVNRARAQTIATDSFINSITVTDNEEAYRTEKRQKYEQHLKETYGGDGMWSPLRFLKSYHVNAEGVDLQDAVESPVMATHRVVNSPEYQQYAAYMKMQREQQQQQQQRARQYSHEHDDDDDDDDGGGADADPSAGAASGNENQNQTAGGAAMSHQRPPRSSSANPASRSSAVGTTAATVGRSPSSRPSSSSSMLSGSVGGGGGVAGVEVDNNTNGAAASPASPSSRPASGNNSNTSNSIRPGSAMKTTTTTTTLPNSGPGSKTSSRPATGGSIRPASAAGSSSGGGGVAGGGESGGDGAGAGGASTTGGVVVAPDETVDW